MFRYGLLLMRLIVKAFCHGLALRMKHGLITFNHRQEDSVMASSSQNKFKVTPLAGRVMATVFCSAEGTVLVDIMPHGETINSDLYVQTLKTWQKHFRRV